MGEKKKLRKANEKLDGWVRRTMGENLRKVEAHARERIRELEQGNAEYRKFCEKYEAQIAQLARDLRVTREERDQARERRDVIEFDLLAKANEKIKHHGKEAERRAAEEQGVELLHEAEEPSEEPEVCALCGGTFGEVVGRCEGSASGMHNFMKREHAESIAANIRALEDAARPEPER